MTPTQREAALRLIADGSSGNLEWSRQVIALLRELAAVPQAEPVAWWIPKAEQFCIAKASGERPFAKAWEPLYAAPQQRQPLTVGQIKRIAAQCESGACDQSQTTSFARAIEAAHGITEAP